jgi:hypothetical protein
MNKVENTAQIEPITVEAEDFREEKSIRRSILQPLVVRCPHCGFKGICNSRKVVKFKVATCKHCHVKTNLIVVGKLIRFGIRGQWFKISWIQE